MKVSYLIITLHLLVTACTEPMSNTPFQSREPPASTNKQPLYSYPTQDPVKTATLHARQGLLTLMGTANRGGVMAPGISKATMLKVKNKCPVKLMKAMGDTIRGKEHLKYQHFMYRYALRYNQTMIRYCYSY